MYSTLEKYEEVAMATQIKIQNANDKKVQINMNKGKKNGQNRGGGISRRKPAAGSRGKG